MSSSTQQMSATEALDFHYFSVHNAAQAQLACPSTSCEAYRDILTRRRWSRPGLHRSQRRTGAAITTWITTTSPKNADDDQPIRRPKRVFVFCRHQVERVH